METSLLVNSVVLSSKIGDPEVRLCCASPLAPLLVVIKGRGFCLCYLFAQGMYLCGVEVLAALDRIGDGYDVPWTR